MMLYHKPKDKSNRIFFIRQTPQRKPLNVSTPRNTTRTGYDAALRL